MNRYYIANTFLLIILLSTSCYGVWVFIPVSAWLKLLLVFVLTVFLAFLEERVLSGYVNEFVSWISNDVDE